MTAAHGSKADSDKPSAVAAIRAIDPNYGDHVVADLKKRNLYPDLIQAMVEGLRKAGLPAR